ncbi:MAG: VirB4-like conjugal transfer ATPase, CD1110 family, partial [Anaerovoracaceae bacterium]
ISIFDVLIGGGRYELSAGQRSIIDRCTRNVYKRYYENCSLAGGGTGSEYMPTLRDFYNELRKQQGYDAVELATALEIYAVGSQSLFSERTNVDCNNRFTVFDIKDVGSSLKTLALLVVLDNVWNQIVDGRSKGRHVWFYIDEIYLLFKSDSSAEFLRTLYKRARKYGGIPTGITQNVADILEHDIARTMLSNSEFIQMLNQAPLDRNQLAQLLNISQTQLSYITNSSPGEGLIYTGASIIPFKNQLPKNTKMYEAMTTKLEEVKAIQRKASGN